MTEPTPVDPRLELLGSQLRGYLRFALDPHDRRTTRLGASRSATECDR